MKQLLTIGMVLILTACGGNTYKDHYEVNRAKGMTFREAVAATDAHCLNNPCNWQ